jgi:hypothetical protein
MFETLPRLDLPLIQQGQAQKHVTHNEALELLDILVQLTVEAFDAVEPPLSPAEGQIWALSSEPAGAWSGHAGQLAAWANGGWLFVSPKPGWRAAMGDDLRIWADGAWVAPRLPELNDLPGLGVNAAHDHENRLVVSSAAALFNHAGADHRLKINKAAPSDSASLLFQTAFSGRAELATAGSDDFAIKVSADGTDWRTALSIDAATGTPALKAGATIDGALAFHRGNILGGVAQAAGTPTGAVIEHGSNANGDYLRLADGTQICWRTVTESSVPITMPFAGWFISDHFDYHYAAGFITRPTVMVVADRAPGGSVGNYAQPDLHNAMRVRFRWARLTSSTQNVAADILAIGRWF